MAVIVPVFEGDTLICPLQCLTSYIRRTSSLRSESKESSLFILFVKPHKPVSSASVACWLKSVLLSAGIEGFMVYFIWGAGTLKVASKGLSTQEIMRLADWLCESIFKWFYCRPLSEYSYIRYFKCTCIFRSCIVINFLISNYSYLVA